jgi:hypothetical protein
MSWDFRERLNFSQGVVIGEAITSHLMASIPGSVGARPATVNEDRSGTDLWIDREGLPPVSVDFKHRSFCPIVKLKSDDACIETCSVFQDNVRKKIGWTLDASKRTDLIVYTWPAKEGTRFWILWFPFLCRAATLNWERWCYVYTERPAQNNDYQTLNVFVPRTEIARAMRDLTVGCS